MMMMKRKYFHQIEGEHFSYNQRKIHHYVLGAPLPPLPVFRQNSKPVTDWYIEGWNRIVVHILRTIEQLTLTNESPRIILGSKVMVIYRKLHGRDILHVGFPHVILRPCLLTQIILLFSRLAAIVLAAC